MYFQKQVFFFKSGLLFNNTIICYCLKRHWFKGNAHTLYATHKLFFLTIMMHVFPKTSVFLLNLGYILTMQSFAIVWKGLNSREKAHTLYATHKLFFLIIMKHVFPITNGFLNLGYFLTTQSFAIFWKDLDSREKHTLYTQPINSFYWQ